MKKIFAIMAAVVCLWGCEKNEIFTPMTVTLASEGQTMTVETTIQPQTLDILDYDGNGTNMPEYDAETGTYTCSYLWLTASISESSYKDGKYTVVLTAEKNTTGIARTLYVGGMDKNYSDSMKVRQEQSHEPDMNLQIDPDRHQPDTKVSTHLSMPSMMVSTMSRLFPE